MSQGTVVRFSPVITWGHITIVMSVLGTGIGLYITEELRAYDHDFRLRALERFETESTTANAKISDTLLTILTEIAAVKARLPSDRS